jgi:hypothetical protein
VRTSSYEKNDDFMGRGVEKEVNDLEGVLYHGRPFYQTVTIYTRNPRNVFTADQPRGKRVARNPNAAPLIELTTEQAKLVAAQLKAIEFSIPRKSVVRSRLLLPST